MSHLLMLLPKFFYSSLLIAAASCSGPVNTGSGTEHPKIYTTGEMERRVEPNMAKVTFAVLTRAGNADKAREGNAAKTNAVVDKLKELKVPEEDLETLEYRIQEVINYQKGDSKIEAYEVLSRMQLKIKDVKSVGKIIDQLVPLGANKIESVEFDVIEKEEIYKELLAEATTLARDKAAHISEAAGLGKISVIEAREEPRNNPGPLFRGGFAMMESARADNSTPLAASTVIKASVSLTAKTKD